jgi:hypothetical protein
MNDIKKNAHELANKIYYEGIKPLIVEKENYAYIKDPIFDIKRNRVIAEIVKAMIRLKLEPDGSLIDKFCNFLVKNQNTDGSWNEIHPNYNQPSALVSSIIGESLLLVYEKYGEKKIKESILRVKNYVLSQYKSEGYFIKSKYYTADHLNVDATCGAFLALYGRIFNDDYCINIAKQTAKHICDNQFTDGSFPYTTNRENYTNAFSIPCIHYQGVTMFYLIKIHNILQEEYIKKSLSKAGNWLMSVQKEDGKFDWSHSGLMFAYYLTGAYAFCFASLLSLSEWEKKYAENEYKCLKILEENSTDLVLRWEKDTWITFPFSLLITIKTSKIGNFPIKQKLFRFGYGLYRQMARRRFSMHLDDKLFIQLTKLFKIKTSTIEPFSNHGDLFMSSEVLDCLSSIAG